MEHFLEHIARSLHTEFGNTLNRHCLVFPNRRAGLYFLKYLAAGIEKPVWAPSILTMNELFKSYSSSQVAGNEILLFELYKVYRRLKKSHESFDDFYFWGDMLLNDFDDVDKYLAEASLLFRNVQDIKTIDQQFGGLTDVQIEIIKRFWINFDPDKNYKQYLESRYGTEDHQLSKKGTAIAMTEPMGGPLSYANVKLVKEGSTDTLTYISNFMGMVNYDLPTNSSTKYIAIISPGIDNISYQKGDEFKPYKSEFIINSGENPLFYLHKKH